MKGGSVNLPDPNAEPGNLNPDDLATNREAVPVPLVAGEVKAALVWLSQPWNQFTKEAPMERPGKK